jgi:diguanylate cyclase
VHLTNSWDLAYQKSIHLPGGNPYTVTAAFDELDFEYATLVAEKAMRSMAEQHVPPTPNNFHVWFKYTLGAPPVLKRAIDILIGNKRKFDAHTNRDIYESYVGSKAADEAVAYDVSQQLQAVMASARQFLTTAIADNRTQMAAINDVSERTEAGLDPKVLIESLMSELAKAATRATRLEASFVEKSRELDTIRDSLIKSEERAKTDTLTGLPNRRALEEFFRKTQLAALEQGEAVSALLIDIDHFKRFNDEFGHGVGDQVLRRANALSFGRDQLPTFDLGNSRSVISFGADFLIGVSTHSSIEVCQARLDGAMMQQVPGPARLHAFLVHEPQAFADGVDHRDRRGVMVDARLAPVLPHHRTQTDRFVAAKVHRMSVAEGLEFFVGQLGLGNKQPRGSAADQMGDAIACCHVFRRQAGSQIASKSIAGVRTKTHTRRSAPMAQPS